MPLSTASIRSRVFRQQWCESSRWSAMCDEVWHLLLQPQSEKPRAVQPFVRERSSTCQIHWVERIRLTGLKDPAAQCSDRPRPRLILLGWSVVVVRSGGKNNAQRYRTAESEDIALMRKLSDQGPWLFDWVWQKRSVGCTAIPNSGGLRRHRSTVQTFSIGIPKSWNISLPLIHS